MTTSEKKVVRHRLSALQLAEALGNASEACRRRGLSRTQFYEYKRRFQTHGLEGLKEFLVVVLDVFLRRIVGVPFSVGCRAKEWLVALDLAVGKNSPKEAGSQLDLAHGQQLLADIQSLSERPGYAMILS